MIWSKKGDAPRESGEQRSGQCSLPSCFAGRLREGKNRRDFFWPCQLPRASRQSAGTTSRPDLPVKLLPSETKPTRLGQLGLHQNKRDKARKCTHIVIAISSSETKM